MTISKEQFENFMYDFFANHAFRHGDACDGYYLHSIEQDGNSIIANYHIHYVKGDHDFEETFILFRTGSILVPNFPMGVQKYTFKEKYIWGSEETLKILDLNDVYEENIDLDMESIYWSDPLLSEDTIERAFDQFDSWTLGQALVTIYGATKDKIPSFIPDRIKPRIKLCIDEYLNAN